MAEAGDGSVEAVERVWRQCSDGLPEIGERVLIAVPGSNRPVQEACRLHGYDKDTNWWWETPNGAAGRGYVILPVSVSVWRPLPTLDEALTASRAAEMQALLERLDKSCPVRDEKLHPDLIEIDRIIIAARALLGSLDTKKTKC
jgi:hypothetical protein